MRWLSVAVVVLALPAHADISALQSATVLNWPAGLACGRFETFDLSASEALDVVWQGKALHFPASRVVNGGVGSIPLRYEIGVEFGDKPVIVTRTIPRWWNVKLANSDCSIKFTWHGTGRANRKISFLVAGEVGRRPPLVAADDTKGIVARISTILQEAVDAIDATCRRVACSESAKGARGRLIALLSTRHRWSPDPAAGEPTVVFDSDGEIIRIDNEKRSATVRASDLEIYRSQTRDTYMLMITRAPSGTLTLIGEQGRLVVDEWWLAP